MKLFIFNAGGPDGCQPFSTDIENADGEQIRLLVPPGATVCEDNVDPLYINQDQNLKDCIKPEWLRVWFECEADDLVALNTKICVPGGGPADCGQLLVANPDGVFIPIGPGTDGDVLIWDSADPNCVRFGPAATAITVEDEGAPIGTKSIFDFVGAGVTATNVGGGRARISIPGGVSGISAEDEGVPVAGGPFTTINIVGPGVVATDAGGGVLNITHAPGAFDVDTILLNCDCLPMCNCDGNMMVVC